MNLIERISRLISANINHLLDQAEDPELMVKQMIRDMEGSIVELRRETVRGVARVKQIEKQIA
ncbi:MAG: PspA/IM30 family protein, partial [Candidatus Omnitrophica bacterium]|nr:PspA/IM30 family protein [Candidatus Omnitrophota bacterium]